MSDNARVWVMSILLGTVMAAPMVLFIWALRESMR